VTPGAIILSLEREEALRMAAEHVATDEQLIAIVVPSRLPEFLGKSRTPSARPAMKTASSDPALIPAMGGHDRD